MGDSTCRPGELKGVNDDCHYCYCLLFLLLLVRIVIVIIGEIND